MRDDGYSENSLKFGSLTMESDRYITICSKQATKSANLSPGQHSKTSTPPLPSPPNNGVVLIDIQHHQTMQIPILQVDAALTHPHEQLIAIRCIS